MKKSKDKYYLFKFYFIKILRIYEFSHNFFKLFLNNKKEL